MFRLENDPDNSTCELDNGGLISNMRPKTPKNCTELMNWNTELPAELPDELPREAETVPATEPDTMMATDTDKTAEEAVAALENSNPELDFTDILD